MIEMNLAEFGILLFLAFCGAFCLAYGLILKIKEKEFTKQLKHFQTGGVIPIDKGYNLIVGGHQPTERTTTQPPKTGSNVQPAPSKNDKESYITFYRCPTCDSYNRKKRKRCIKCSQALDWKWSVKMAYAKKCDRCGDFYEKQEASGTAAAFVDMEKQFDCRKSTELIEHLEEKIDLCPKCKNSFKKWFKRKVGAETHVDRRYVPPPSIKTVKSEGVTLDPCPGIETEPVPMSTANTLRG